MKDYKVIYPFEVYETIKKGQKVYMLDREDLSTTAVSTLSIEEWVSVLALAEKEKTRFEFWVENEKENNTNE